MTLQQEIEQLVSTHWSACTPVDDVFLSTLANKLSLIEFAQYQATLPASGLAVTSKMVSALCTETVTDEILDPKERALSEALKKKLASLRPHYGGGRDCRYEMAEASIAYVKSLGFNVKPCVVTHIAR